MQMKRYELLKILLILSIPYIGSSLIQTGFPTLLPYIREEFALSRVQVGYYSTCFFFSASLLAIFSGIIVDRLGVKKGLLLGVGSLGIIALLYGFSSSYIILLLLALIAGFGFSIITPSANLGVMIETPSNKRAFSMGIMQSGVGVGGLAGAIVIPMLGNYFGWRVTIQFAGFFVIVMGLLIYRYYHETIKDSSIEGNHKINREKPPSILSNINSMVSNKQFLFTCFFGMILAGSSVGVILSHFTVFLFEDLHINVIAAGIGLGVFQIGGIVGRLIWGWLSDRILYGDRYKALYLAGLVCGMLFLIPGLYLKNPQPSLLVVYVFSFCLGTSANGWIGVYFVIISESTSEGQTGGATGLALLFNRIGLLTAPPIFGLIADLKGNYSNSWLVFGTLILLISFLYFGLSKRVCS